MLTFTGSEEKQGTCFKLLGTAKPASNPVHLISDNTSLIAPTHNCNGGLDTVSFYSGPTDSAIIAFGENSESCGSVAYADSESCGSVAYSGGSESCGSVASSSSCSSGGGCSYSC